MSLQAPSPSPELVTALSQSWFGAGLAPETVARLAAIAELRAVEPGDEVTREGQVTEAVASCSRAGSPCGRWSRSEGW